jgi:alpha-ketoglutarate-dependent taurine dioxygenase
VPPSSSRGSDAASAAPNGPAESSPTVGKTRRTEHSPSGRRLPAAVRGLLGTARRQLADRGWTLLPDVPFRDGGEPDERAILDLASAFGVPSARDGGRAVWPVAPAGPSKAVSSKAASLRAASFEAASSRATFSTSAGAAGFHTDAQYHAEPEDYVCLFVVRPASDGGSTRLLSAETAICALRARPDGAELVELMSRPIWRWRVPAEFAVTVQAGMAPTAGLMAALMPVPAAPGGLRIRWRSDNLDPALPESLHDAASLIGTVFNRAQGAVELQPRPGDVLILDNHRVMHARTWFSDPRRLLLRVRLWRP